MARHVRTETIIAVKCQRISPNVRCQHESESPCVCGVQTREGEDTKSRERSGSRQGPLGKQTACIFKRFVQAWETDCMHIYTVFYGMGRQIAAYLHSLLWHGTPDRCIFTQFPMAWDARSLHIYTVCYSMGHQIAA